MHPVMPTRRTRHSSMGRERPCCRRRRRPMLSSSATLQRFQRGNHVVLRAASEWRRRSDGPRLTCLRESAEFGVSRRAPALGAVPVGPAFRRAARAPLPRSPTRTPLRRPTQPPGCTWKARWLRLYRPAPVQVGSSPLGCRRVWAGESPPGVTACNLASGPASARPCWWNTNSESVSEKLWPQMRARNHETRGSLHSNPTSCREPSAPNRRANDAVQDAAVHKKEKTMQNKELLRVHGPAYARTHVPRCKAKGTLKRLPFLCACALSAWLTGGCDSGAPLADSDGNGRVGRKESAAFCAV